MPALIESNNRNQIELDRSKPVLWLVECDEMAKRQMQKLFCPDYRVFLFSNLALLREALQSDETRLPDLIISGAALADGAFLPFIERQSESANQVIPFMVLFDDAAELSSLEAAYRVGAAEVMTKPLALSELKAKVDRILVAKFSQQHDLDLDLGKLMLTNDQGKEVCLTPKEVQIVTLMKSGATDRNEIIFRVWRGLNVSRKAFDVHLFNLRRKLQEIGYGVEHTPPHSYRLTKIG